MKSAVLHVLLVTTSVVIAHPTLSRRAVLDTGHVDRAGLGAVPLPSDAPGMFPADHVEEELRRREEEEMREFEKRQQQEEDEREKEAQRRRDSRRWMGQQQQQQSW